MSIQITSACSAQATAWLMPTSVPRPAPSAAWLNLA